MDVLDSIKREVRSRAAVDPAHDFGHVMRVYKNAKRICESEGANERLVLSAALLHDIVSLPKSDPRSGLSAAKSAREAKKILQKYGFTPPETQTVCDAIRDHSFSGGRTPQTIEGKILQDADRLDAVGAVGIARAFAVGGSEKRPFYNEDDPFCRMREPDDRLWTLDHFYAKLLKLESLMNTGPGRAEAKQRTRALRGFLAQLKKEI